MRTSLIEIAQIENWIEQNKNAQGELKLCLLPPELKEKVKWQSLAYELVSLYGREKLTEEIKTIERRLFYSSKYRSFQQRIQSIFKK